MVVDFEDLDQSPQPQPQPQPQSPRSDIWRYFTISINNEIEVTCNICSTRSIRWTRSYPTDLLYSHLVIVHNIII
jgi:hypothetical protein